jgi:hypothetical protein
MQLYEKKKKKKKLNVDGIQKKEKSPGYHQLYLFV